MPSFYIVLEKEIPGVDVYVNGNFLSKNNDQLGQIAKRLKVKPLMDFFSTSQEEVSSLLEGSGVKLKAVPEEKWFAADEGLTTVNALLASSTKSKLARADQIEVELREFESLLEKAKANGVRWHLAVDY